MDDQYIPRNFHQACKNKVQINASTKFSWAQREPVIYHTIHKPVMIEVILQRIIILPYKKSGEITFKDFHRFPDNRRIECNK